MNVFSEASRETETPSERRPSWMMEILCPQSELGRWGSAVRVPAEMVTGPSAAPSLAATAPSSCPMVTAWIGPPAPTGTTGRPLLPAPTQLLPLHTWICVSTTALTPTRPSHLLIWCGTARVARHTTYTAPAQKLPHLDTSALTRHQISPHIIITTLWLCQVASAVERTTTVPTTLPHLTATTMPTPITLSPPPTHLITISC